MHMDQVREANGLSQREFGERIGVRHSGYISQLCSGGRTPPRALAIRVWQEFGAKVGPLVAVDDADIEALARIEGAAA